MFDQLEKHQKDPIHLPEVVAMLSKDFGSYYQAFIKSVRSTLEFIGPRAVEGASITSKQWQRRI